MLDRDFTLGKPHVVVIGDAMLDRYMVGTSTRKSPEADVPVLQDYEISSKVGGAANVAISCSQLGGEVTLISLVGSDEEGQQLRDLLAKTSVKAHWLLDDGRPTTVKTRILCNDQHLLRVDRESTVDFDEVTEIVSRLRIEEESKHIDVLILQDYNKGILNPNSIDAILSFANTNDIAVAVDPKMRHFDSYKGVALFKPNRREAEALLGRTIRSIDEARTAAAEIAKNLDAKSVLLTLGADGVVYIDDNCVLHQPISTGEIIDVCGAGDAVLATCAMAWVLDGQPYSIASLAVLAGAAACQVTGVSPIALRDFIRT